MFSFFPIVRKFALLLAAVALCGGQWAALQVVAWTGMAFNYSAEYGLKKGLTKTFDGTAPCPMCKHIQKAKKTEEKQPATSPAKAAKIEALADTGLTVKPDSFSLISAMNWPAFLARAVSRSERPLLMPPRSAA